MSKYAHKGQILPLENQMIPIDKETTFHASYDYGLHGFNQGKRIQPNQQQSVLYFDGVNGTEINTPNISFSATESWSAECWMYCEVPDGSWVFFLGDDTTHTTAIVISTSSYLGFRANDASYHYSSAPIVRTQWSHLCVTYDNGSISFYINGVASGTATQSSGMTFNNIGWAYTSYSAVPAFKGKMSEIRIWNRSLSELEIQDNMNKILNGHERNLVGYWKLNEKEGPISFDHSENQNDGVWNGGITSTYGPTVASKVEGKFRGGVLVEPDSKNIAPNTDYSNHAYGQSYTASSWNGDEATVTYYSSGGYNGMPYKKMVKTAGGTGGSYRDEHMSFAIEDNKTYVISCWMKANMVVNVGSHALDINRASDNAYRTHPSITLDTEWKRYHWVYNSGTGHAGTDYKNRGIIYVDDNLPLEVYWCGFQIEERDHPTSRLDSLEERPLGKLWYPKELVSPNAFTISCWFNMPYMHRVSTNNTGIQGNWYHPIVEIATPTNSSQSFGIVAGPEPSSWSRKLLLQVPGNTSGTGFAVQDDTWYHLTCTYDGATYRVYVDGTEYISYAGGSIAPVDGEVLMMGGGYRGKAFIKIDEVRIESRAITTEEISAWAASGLHYNYLDYSMVVD